MQALIFGLGAAVCWAIHDLLARKLSQGVALLPLLAVVMLAGIVVLVPFALNPADWQAMTGAAWPLALVSGLAFALATGGLYKAFSLAPVRLVSPIVGAYPLLSLAIAVAENRPVAMVDFAAVILIVIGIAIVARAARGDSADSFAAPPRVAIGWALMAAVGFAGTLALSQAAARSGADFPVMLIGRSAAFALIVLLIALQRPRQWWPDASLGLLSGMGAVDALALGLVTASGTLPRAEYAAVSSSLFGVLTVLLAALFLRERVRAVQWLGIATVFSGVAMLTFQG